MGPEEEFCLLVEQWRAETGYLSSPERIMNHPLYQRILTHATGNAPDREIAWRYWTGELNTWRK